jgi:predicted RecA/RadA family phage recombinase
MQNYKQPGKTMTYTAPAGGVTSGGGYLIGALFVVACATAAAAAEFEGATEGVFELPKTITEGNLVEGQPVYWDVANSKVTIDPSLGLPIGTLAAAALTAATVCDVRLHGVSLAGRMLTVRKRFTIAQFNAGATLLPALPGLKFRMVDAAAIAVGGAAGAVTTADILATQATASVKLVAFAQASLTQNTMLRAGAAGAAILAAGASFAQNDVNTAITVGKTGADITTATHIDVSLTYSIE